MSYSAFFFLLSSDYHVVICVSKWDREQTVDTWPTNDSYESSCRRDRFSAIAGNFCFFFFFFFSKHHLFQHCETPYALKLSHTDNESSKKGGSAVCDGKHGSLRFPSPCVKWECDATRDFHHYRSDSHLSVAEKQLFNCWWKRISSRKSCL